MADEAENKSYGKRPLWQWLVVYLLVAVVVYGLVYYFVLAKKGGYTTTPTPTPKTTQSTAAPSSNIYLMKTDPAKGSYLTDFAGMTLYTYDKDTGGVSNCTGTCAANWPPYTSGATAESKLPTDVSVITRADGSKQLAWKGMPLYYFASDASAGQITGDGVGGFHLAK